MTACLVPVCEAPTLDLGVWAFLCLEHALEATASPSAPRQGPPKRTLVDLRGRCWGEGMTCDRPATTITAHGGYCRGHAPEQPTPPTHGTSTPDEERVSQLAVLAIMGAFPGAKASEAGPSLWASRVYGETGEPPNVTRSVTYPRATACRAVTIPLDDERVPRNARGMARARGWSHRLSLVEDNGSVMLKSWRGPYLVVACWLGGKFESAWVQHSRGTPMRLGAREAGKLLKMAP